MTDHADRRATLEARRAELAARLAAATHGRDEPLDPGFSDQATEAETEEVIEDLGALAATEMRMIDAALARIDEGSYGECVKCGEAILPERLDLLPHTPFCRYCAAGKDR